jgi:hypothetical protein
VDICESALNLPQYSPPTCVQVKLLFEYSLQTRLYRHFFSRGAKDDKILELNDLISIRLFLLPITVMPCYR